MLVLVLPLFRRADPDEHHDSPQITAAAPHSILKGVHAAYSKFKKSRWASLFVCLSKKLEAMEKSIIFAIMTLSTLQKKKKCRYLL